jgi:Na+/H+ antiporter NhaD/arsenite permease-like protein
MKDFLQGPFLWQSVAAVIIFLAAYILIAVERWNRTYVALSGAVVMLALGIVPWHEAFTTYMNWQIIGLLTGLYVIAGFMHKTGIFPFAALSLIRITQGKPVKMLFILCLLTAIGSALFDGIWVLIILVPFTLGAARMLKISPMSFIMAQMLSANLGGMATLVGNLPNRIIGTSADLSFTRFLTAIGPLALILIAILIGIISILYGKRLVIAEAQRKELLVLTPSYYLADRKLLLQGGIVGILILVAFLIQGMVGLSSGLIAIVGALILMIVDYKEIIQTVNNKDYRQLWQEILDSQVLFILGLLVMTGGLVHSGITDFIAARMMEITQGNLPFSALLLLWVTGIGSALLDSIPFVAAMLVVLKDVTVLLGLDAAHAEILWWALAIGAGIGGGGTLLGSPANLIAAGLSEQEGSRISYGDYLKWAGPLTLLFLLLASFYLYFLLL